MKLRTVGGSFLACALLLAGCSQQSTQPNSQASERPAQGATGPIVQAQPQLQTIKIYLGPKELNTELALTDQQRMAGMMFRTNIAETEGMLFVFPYPHQTGFWMKNVTVPLSAAYIDSQGAILEIHDLEPGNTNPVVAGSDRIQYVLETAQGWFPRNGVNTGAVIRTDRGSLAETFSFRR